jgi:uncharacterized protein (TIGR02246 family)
MTKEISMTAKSIIVVLLLGWGISQVAQVQIAISQDTKSSDQPAEEADLLQLRATSVAFEKAFNAGDAKAIGALFLEKAEVVDEDGNLVQGRDNIEARFAEIFKASPEAQISVEVTSLRQLSPAVAVEEGVSAVALTPQESASRSPYTLVHLKRDGKWLFASIRDFPEEVTETPHEHLMPLEWLVGHWVDESPSGRVETTCEWSEDGNYLLMDYVVKARNGGELKGTQRIGWDPLKHTIRAWVFDQSGGMIESEWTPVQGVWVVKGEGHNADGLAVSFNRLFTPISTDGYQIDSTHQLVGGELLPDTTVRVVRRPPMPVE